ncbi:MAG: DUF1538 domain-containing protein [Gammaproteobacteria bacterium]|nr:MAG: DUF1538 domain-containing protein [Gammaproteobacteria bacterium]
MEFLQLLYGTVFDVLPILSVIFVFQLLILKQKIPHLRQVLTGIVFVVVGLSLFLIGLEQALFPLGKSMALQLTDTNFIKGDSGNWRSYYWVYLFSFSIGFATTMAEPSLIAVAIKAAEVSGGTIKPLSLRIAVATGMAFGVVLGSLRIITGTQIHYYIIIAYFIVIILTYYSDKNIIPLAYDLGGVTTSTVTVPLVAALGLGLAQSVPGRSVLIDGFGLIAFACLGPIISVLCYAKISILIKRYKK